MTKIPFGMHAGCIDVYTSLNQNRIVLLNGEINDEVSVHIIAQLLYLDNINNEDISIYINSPGGVCTAGMAIYDTMRLCKSKIKTVVIGQASSMGSIIALSGDERYATKYSRIMLHQPLGGAIGQVTDMEIQIKEVKRIKEILYSVIEENTDLSGDDVIKYCDRDWFIEPEEAIRYGIIDKII